MYIEDFLSYLQLQKRYSPHTINSYQLDLSQFTGFLTQEYTINNIREVEVPIIRSWIVHLLDQKISTRSVNRKISCLKSYYKYLQRKGHIDRNPMQKVIPPKTAKKLPVFVEEDSMKRLLEEVDFGEGWIGARDKLIIEMFYSTGMRLSELINLKDTDIDFSLKTVKVLGKRNKERLIPLSSRMLVEIESYIIMRREALNQTEQIYLFRRKDGKKINENLVYELVNLYLSKVTTISKKSPHVLRHTFATHMLNNGADLNAIKELLGHANLAATQVYTHNTIEKLKSIYKQAHPKA